MKDDMAVGVDLGMTGLAYNKKMFDEKGWAAPTSWMDLADPEVQGQGRVPVAASASSFGLHAFLMFNRIQGGNEKNVEPGFAKFRDTIGPNVLEYIPSSAKISEMVQTGEAAIFPLTPTGVATLQGQGHSGRIRAAQGRLGGADGGAVRHRQQQRAGAGAEARRVPALGRRRRRKALASRQHRPSNTKAKAPTPEAEKKLETFHGYMKTAVTLDWDAINAKRPEWNSRWNKTIER